MISSFHPHSICKKVERVTAKTGCTSCTKRTISFKVSGFHTETRLLQRDFIFLNLFELLTFCVFKMHHSNPHHQLLALSEFIWYFSFIYWFVLRELNDREIEKQYKLNSEKVEPWRGIIISLTWHVQKSREGHGKNWMHFVYKLDNLFRSIRVSDENSSVTRALQCFLNLFEL